MIISIYIKNINSKDKDVLIDNRGWKKGIPRKYTIEAKEEIINIANTRIK